MDATVRPSSRHRHRRRLLAAHASLVAREYAIPAVVATANATLRLHSGQLVTVDGSAGTVTPHDEHITDQR
jgi:phosphoenolpyruvate-protein kinase (PTS system EI component)